MAHPIPARLTPAQGRRFAFPVGFAFVLLGAIVLWRDHTRVAAVLGGLGVVLLLAGLVVPGRLSPVYRTWMGLALAISRVTTPVVMAVLYFVVIAPTGLLRRVLGGNPIVHDGRRGSYWITRSGEARSDLRRQF